MAHIKEISQSKICETVDVASSTWYEKQSSPKDKEDRRKLNPGRSPSTCSLKDGNLVSDDEVRSRLKGYRDEPFFGNGGGYHKLTHYLRREGYVINKKKVYRLCQEAEVLLPRKGKKGPRRTPISVNRTVTRPLQLWELDIKYGYIHGENRFFFIMAIVDVFLRYVVGFHIGLNCLGKDLVRTLSIGMKSMEVPVDSKLVIRMDNGPQMTSNAMFKFAESKSESLIHELIPVMTPNKNAHIESFYSIIEAELFQTHIFENYVGAYSKTHEFIDFYHNRRVHGSLGMRTPNECLGLFRQGNLSGIKPIRL